MMFLVDNFLFLWQLAPIKAHLSLLWVQIRHFSLDCQVFYEWLTIVLFAFLQEENQISPQFSFIVFTALWRTSKPFFAIILSWKFTFEDLPLVSFDLIIFFSKTIISHWIFFPNSTATLRILLYFRYEYC